MEVTTFNALAESNRLRIVELLRERPRSVNEIAHELNLRQPQVSKHLRALSEADIVMVYPLAQQRFYGLQPQSFKELNDWVQQFRRFWDTTSSIADEYLGAVKERQAAMDKTAHRLTIERIFNAPPALVWTAWTDPQHIVQWWVPDYFVGAKCETEVRPGGRFYLEMQAPDGTIHPMEAVYKDIAKPQQLDFVASPLDPAGNKLFKALHHVTFSELAGQTKLSLKTRVLSATQAAGPYLASMESSWKQSLDKLDHLLAVKINH